MTMYKLPRGEEVIQILELSSGAVLVATTLGVYWMQNDKLVPMEFCEAPHAKSSHLEIVNKP